MKKWKREVIFSWYFWRIGGFNFVLIFSNRWCLETLIGGASMACIHSISISIRFLQVNHQQLLLNICMDLLHFLLTLPLIVIPIKNFLYDHGANYLCKPLSLSLSPPHTHADIHYFFLGLYHMIMEFGLGFWFLNWP